jgi:ferric-dicitrate binding protein FerR (iron transport regulator)
MPVSGVPRLRFAGFVGVGRPSGRRQRMTLDRIEKALLADAPDLRSAFEIFTKLTCHEAMPGTERALPRQRTARPRRQWPRRQWRMLLITAGFIACLGALVSVTAAFGSHACGIGAGPHQSTVQTASCRPAQARAVTQDR